MVVDDEDGYAARSRRTGRASAGGTSVTVGRGAISFFGLVDGDTLLSGPLRGVERLVGVREQRVLLQAVVGERGNADRDGRQRIRSVERFDRLPESLGRACRGVGTAAHDDGELVAADAEDLFAGARLRTEDTGDRRRARGRRRRVPLCR